MVFLWKPYKFSKRVQFPMGVLERPAAWLVERLHDTQEDVGSTPTWTTIDGGRRFSTGLDPGLEPS